MVLSDQDTVIGEQDVDAAHHVVDVFDVREDIAGRDDLRMSVLATIRHASFSVKNSWYADRQSRLEPAGSVRHPPSGTLELAEQRPVVRADINDKVVWVEWSPCAAARSSKLSCSAREFPDEYG